MGRTQNVIADTISKELELPERVGRHFLQRVLDLVADDIVYTRHIELRGLGTFSVTIRPPMETTHPVTGEPVHVPEKKVIRYHSSAALRRRLNPPAPARKKRTRKRTRTR